MSDELDARIKLYFGDDEHPEASWRLLHPFDQRWIRRVIGTAVHDPNVMTKEQFSALGADARFERIRDLEDWFKIWPYVRSRQVRDIERHLAALPIVSDDFDAGLIDVPVITGPPGVGKTFLMKRAAVRAMCLAARDRRLKLARRPEADDYLVKPDWRPVIYHSVDGNPREKVFFARLCSELGIPAGAEPQATFAQAARRHGVRWVFIDEVQMINFDGQFGMHLHNALKAVQNDVSRVVLAGHTMREQLTPRKTVAQNAAQSQSLARWAFLELKRYPHETRAHVAEWRAFLREYDRHLRLAGHAPGAPVFSEEFEEHLWVLTLGYVNALSSLVVAACLTAARTSSQRITAQILDSVRLNERVAKGQEARLKRWRAGTMAWSVNAPAAL